MKTRNLYFSEILRKTMQIRDDDIDARAIIVALGKRKVARRHW